MEWLARSPGLHNVEYLCGATIRDIYEGVKR